MESTIGLSTVTFDTLSNRYVSCELLSLLISTYNIWKASVEFSFLGYKHCQLVTVSMGASIYYNVAVFTLLL